MRRDLGGELLVAVAVVAVLVFALIFGVVLSLSNRTPPSADSAEITLGAVSNTDGTAPPINHTPTRTLLITPIDTRTPSPAVTHTAAPLIATIAIVTNASPTQVPATDTAAPPPVESTAVTSTSLPATTQPVATQASTATNTATLTFTPTHTVTLAPPTTPPTLVEPTETAIPVQPSRTSAATLTAARSNTPLIAPSATHTISGVTPTTGFAELTLEATTETTADTTTEASAPECVPTTIGIDYTVTADTSLYAIARSVGTSVYALRRLNCLPVSETIRTGEVLRIPNAPQIPAATTIPLLLPSDQTYLAQGCSLQNALIVSPLPGETLSGIIDITGTANGERFASYRLEIRPAARDIYDLYARSIEPVQQGSLTLLNTDDYDQGLHYLRLSVIDVSEQVVQSCVIPVIFQ